MVRNHHAEQVSLQAGASATVRFSIPREDLALTARNGEPKVFRGLHHLIFSRGNGNDVSVPISRISAS